MKLEEIRASIRDQVAGYVPNDDTRLRNEFIDKVIRDKRALMCRQQDTARFGNDPRYYQDMSCLEVSKEKIHCSGEFSGHSFWSVAVPQTIDVSGAIQYLGTIDLKTPFQYKGITAFLNNTGGRFCIKEPIYTFTTERAYLQNCPDVELLRMIAILEDPRQNTCILDFEQDDYPFPSSHQHQLEVLCIKQILSTLQIPADQKNDAIDSIVAATKGAAQ